MKVGEKKDDALARLIEAEKICEVSPEETESVAREIQGVRAMLG